MGFWRFFLGLMGCLSIVYGADDLWLIEQDFVKFGKKEAYELYKRDLQKDFVKKVGSTQMCIESTDSTQYLYLIAVRDFKGLNSLMEKRIKFHEMLEEGDQTQILPFLSTVNFFIESVHRHLPNCSYVPMGKEAMMAFPYVHYYIYGIVPGNGPVFEEHLKQIAAAQETSETPVCFRTWRVLFGAEIPSYVIAVFADTPKEAKNMGASLHIVDGPMKNILRQERKGSGMFRKDLSAMKN